LATGKINKTSRPSTKKMQTGPITTGKKHLASEPTPEQLKAIERKVVKRDVLLSITDDYTSTCPSPKDGQGHDDFLIGNHFAWGGSQVNTDLAQAAHCESEEDIHLEDETFFAFLASSEYRKLKQTFMDEAEKEDKDAVLNLVWRAYNAGTYSAERRHPDSREVRQERHQHREKAEASHRAAKAEREAREREKPSPEETGK
jgi:hypothetical protein